MKRTVLTLLLALGMMPAFTGILYAAESTADASARHLKMEQIIQERQDTQAQRIQDGVAKGRLTEAERLRLQNQLDKIKQEFMSMKNDTTPDLTRQEFLKLQRELNKNSATIYRLNHNNRRVRAGQQ